MINSSQNLKSHSSNSASSAVDLAYNDPSLSNISFARNLVNLKIKNTEITLNNKNNNVRCRAKDYFNYYELLSKRLNAIEDIYKYQKEFENGNLGEQNKEDLINEAKRVANLNDFRNNQFSKETLSGAWFKNRDLRNATFCFLNIAYKSNTSVDFSGSNLSGVDFKRSFLNNSIFNNCDLTNARLNINSADFTDAKLDGINLRFQIYSFNKSESEYFLNEELSNNTLFHTLNTISDKYKELKIKLVKQIIESINNSGEMKLESFPIDSIINNITAKKYYLEDGVIKDFAKKLLDIKHLNDGFNMYSDKLSSGTLSFILDLISELGNEKIKEYMMKKNGCFIKLMALTVYHNDLAIQGKGRSLYNKYLEIEEIKGFAKKENFGNNEKVYWSDKKNNNYIIVSGDKTIVISHENLVNMLFPDEIGMNASWNKFLLYIKGERKLIEQTNYYDLFNKDFEMFKESYNSLHTK